MCQPLQQCTLCAESEAAAADTSLPAVGWQAKHIAACCSHTVDLVPVPLHHSLPELQDLSKQSL